MHDRRTDMSAWSTEIAFDEWLRESAASAEAVRQVGVFGDASTVPSTSAPSVHWSPSRSASTSADGTSGNRLSRARFRQRLVIGADGARSAGARQECYERRRPRSSYVFGLSRGHSRAEDRGGGRRLRRVPLRRVLPTATLSPDFYAWVFPHGETAMCIGIGSCSTGDCRCVQGGGAELREQCRAWPGL